MNCLTDLAVDKNASSDDLVSGTLTGVGIVQRRLSAGRICGEFRYLTNIEADSWAFSSFRLNFVGISSAYS